MPWKHVNKTESVCHTCSDLLWPSVCVCSADSTAGWTSDVHVEWGRSTRWETWALKTWMSHHLQENRKNFNAFWKPCWKNQQKHESKLSVKQSRVNCLANMLMEPATYCKMSRFSAPPDPHHDSSIQAHTYAALWSSSSVLPSWLWAWSLQCWRLVDTWGERCREDPLFPAWSSYSAAVAPTGSSSWSHLWTPACRQSKKRKKIKTLLKMMLSMSDKQDTVNL